MSPRDVDDAAAGAFADTSADTPTLRHVTADMPAWPDVRELLADTLGQRVDDAIPLTPARPALTWAARLPDGGPVVVKIRDAEDGAAGKTRWCAAHLPLLGARGYPVPQIVWHGPLSAEWYVTVQNRLPGRPMSAVAGPLLDAVVRLVEAQADAGVPAEDRDFTAYVAGVLFDDWDEVWADARLATPAAGALCARLWRWLQPVWGLRLPPVDYVHNDLNLSNILTDGRSITGVVDWDEFGLGSRALDLVALAVDCERGGARAAADRLLADAARVAGAGGLRCLLGYRAIALLAHTRRNHNAYGEGLSDAECAAVSALLDRLGGAG